MKKIIIVNNNMKVGGVQKSLYNLLWAIDGKYDVTLYLFSRTGEYMDKLPPNVKVVGCTGPFRYFGVSQGECKSLSDKLKRGISAALCKVFGRKFIVRLFLALQKRLDGSYDCAVAFLHNGNPKSFYGGVQDFVLDRINADKKIAFLHCDYRNCGANNPYDNGLIAKFDRIAACSDGCRAAFESVLPELENKTVTVRNCHRFDEIKTLANTDPVIYDNDVINVVMVSRLAHEKGIERALRAMEYSLKKGISVRLHIVGGGPMESELHSVAASLGISDSVVFYGEQGNPYRYMKNGDLFLLTSYHEAAPLVIDEAECLGLPILTVKTTSSEEMVVSCGFGWVCDNDTQELTLSFYDVLSKKQELLALRDKLKNRSLNNDIPVRQFERLVNTNGADLKI